MTGTAEAADFDKSLDIESDCTTAITFNLKVVVDVLTQLGNFVF
jgi:hypothetical protein